MEHVRKFVRDQSGQGLPEYALLVAAVVVMVLGATLLFTNSVEALFDRIGTYIGSSNALAS